MPILCDIIDVQTTNIAEQWLKRKTAQRNIMSNRLIIYEVRVIQYDRIKTASYLYCFAHTRPLTVYT